MRKSGLPVFAASVLGSVLLSILTLPAQSGGTYVQHPVRFAISAPLGELAKLPQPLTYGFREENPVRYLPTPPFGPVVDTVEQNSVASSGANYTLGADLVGLGVGFPNFTVQETPPDTNMAVGDTQIVDWVDDSYVVCSKSSPYTCGSPFSGRLLWQNLGGPCYAEADGDIIAQWDVAAHRWLLAENFFNVHQGDQPPYYVCVAISTSADANGTYYLYQFPVVNNGFPDYPKWGVWSNDYGQTWNNFGPGISGYVGPVLCVYDRSKMLAGDQSAEQICHQYTSSDSSLLPADRDSPIAPPADEDHFAIGSVADVDHSHLSLYSAHLNDPNDWSQGATFTGDHNSQLIAVAPYNMLCINTCVPQEGTTDKLDSLADRLMYRFAYWEDQPSANVQATPPRPAPAQHWLVNHSVLASQGNAAVRWYEFTAPIKNVAPTSLTVFQQGTYAPDAQFRWMGSIARDKVGDILVGYSESASNQYPSIYLAGRQVNDPVGLGNLEAEVQVVAGTGAQLDTSNRWGDYSAMRIDTNDGTNGCTFWYTQEYYMATASFDWSTQIASAKFANCN
jgi:hypothetical protein